MRRKYRSQAGIVLDVLEALAREGPLPPTRLAQHANLPYDRLRELLSKLVEEGLVECSEEGERRRVCSLTPRGLEALTKLREARRILERLGYRF